MKIVTKLIVACVLCTLVVALMGLTGLFRLNQADERMDAFAGNILPSVELLAQVQNQTWAARTEVWKHMTHPDQESKLAAEQASAKALDQVEQLLKAYEPMVVDAEDQRLLDQSKLRLREYREGLSPLFALSRNGDVQGAIQMTKAGRGGRLVAALDEHVTYNRKLAQQLQQANSDAAHTALLQSVAIMVLVVVLVAVGGGWLCRTISQGLSQMQNAMAGIAQDLDFTRRVKVATQDEIGATAQQFNALLDRVQHSLQDMKRGIVDISATARQLQQASGSVADSSAQQSNASAHMAAAIEQMTVSLSHVADRTSEAQQLSAVGAEQAGKGQQAIAMVVSDMHAIADTVSDTAQEIGQLAERSKTIESVVGVIRDVAEQTNLLALNAAIEAARAGESGRGFAVVADEVRKLAERTAASTQEIGQIIQSIQQVTGNVVNRMGLAVEQVGRGQQGVSAASDNIGQLLDGAHASARVVQEITEAIREQSVATNSIAQQVETVAQGAEANSSAAGQAAGQAVGLERVAAAMQQNISVYTV